ncbi:GntR family transcriptional regulator [Hwanghaeella sp.]|uniref:GntR family transcriptional regulator n=1 Tax=Hwanghaeella sp. TaxID=2605943 RepID=UPI003CCBD81D
MNDSADALLMALEVEADSDSSLTQRAYRRLEEMIVTLELQPGEVLSESALADRLEIGRTPVREALQRLAREGLVSILSRRGVLVSELDVRRQMRLLEVRRELERLMARLAARRASDAERQAFGIIEKGMQKAASDEDEIEFMRLDRQLNLLLCRASRNDFISNAMGLTHGQSRRFWFQHHREVGDLALCARLHANLAAAVKAGSEEKAAAASDALLDYVEAFTRKTLDSIF